MTNNNQDDRIEMAQEIAEVRKSGVTNMMDRQGVIDALFNLGYDFTAEYIKDNRDDFLNLLELSGDY